MNKKKKQLIIGIIIVVLVIGLILSLKNKKEKEKQETKQIEKTSTATISEVFEIEDIEQNTYVTEKTTANQIASKYAIGKTTYELKADVQLNEKNGKMIYVRESYANLNIYQTEYKLKKYENVNVQIDEIVRDFEQLCIQYLNLDETKELKSETLYGESNQTEEKPLGESIYFDNRLYSKTYKKEEKTYDINFYKNGEKIICELVYELI